MNQTAITNGREDRDDGMLMIILLVSIGCVMTVVVGYIYYKRHLALPREVPPQSNKLAPFEGRELEEEFEHENIIAPTKHL